MRAASQPYPFAIDTKSMPGRSRPGTPGVCSKLGERLEDRVLPVAHDHDQDRQPQLCRAPDRLDRVLEGSVADDRDDRPVAAGFALGQRDPHRRGEVPAQPAAGEGVVRVRLGDRPRLVELGVVRRGLFDQDGVRRPDLVQRREHSARRIGGRRTPVAVRRRRLRRVRGAFPLDRGWPASRSVSAASDRTASPRRLSPTGARPVSAGSSETCSRRSPEGTYGPGDVGVVAEHGRADDQCEVVAFELVAQRAHRERQHAAVERVVLGKRRALGRGRRPDRRIQRLRQRGRLAPAVAPRDGRAVDQDRARTRAERVGELLAGARDPARPACRRSARRPARRPACPSRRAAARGTPARQAAGGPSRSRA